MNTLTHGLYTQTGNFSFEATLSFDDITGHNEFGFSGNASSMGFSFISGKIFDWNQNFVGVYNAFKSVSISGTIGNSTADYYINNEPIAFGINRPTGYFNKLYSGGQNQGIDLNLIVQGNAPSYTIQSSVVFSTGDALVPINVINNSSFPFELFSGNINSSKFSLVNPTGFVVNTGTLNFIPSGIISAGINQVPMNLYTDFGLVSSTITMSGKVDPFSGLFMEILDGPSTIRTNKTGQYRIQYTNLGIPIPIVPYLEYIGGSGMQSIDVPISGLFNVNATGLITYSGDVSSLIHISGSGYAFSSLVSGIINSGISGFQWATGIQLSPVSIIATGIGSGINYTGLATGILNEIISGNILNGSGFYHATNLFSGLPSSVYSVYPTGTTQATGAIYYNTPQRYDVLYIYDNSDGIVNGYDYTTIDELTSLLNAQTNYYVSASKVGGTIHLTSLLHGTSGNFFLGTDLSNLGNMTVSNPTLIGGQDFGIGTHVFPLGTSKVLQASAASSDAYIEKNLSGEAEVWLSFDLAFYTDALTWWLSNSSGEFADLIAGDDSTLIGPYLYGGEWQDNGGFLLYGSPSATPVPVAETWQHCELHYTTSSGPNDGLGEFYINGNLVWSDSNPVSGTVHFGSGAPSNGLGSVGDFYVDTTNNRLYGPKMIYSPPTILSIITGGTPGSTTYGYSVKGIFNDPNGQQYISTLSAEVQISTGAASLNATDYLVITADDPANIAYWVWYQTTVNGVPVSPPTNGWITANTSDTFQDIGYTVQGYDGYPDNDWGFGVPYDSVFKIRIGQNQASFDASAVAYIKNVQAGTTRGGSNIFEDDFSSNDFSAWDNVVGDATLVNDPFQPSFTSYFDNNINGTGIYSQNLTGVAFGSLTYPFNKTFTGVWDMQTGLFSFVDYRQSGFFNTPKDTYIYESGKITSNMNNFLVNISYNEMGTGQDIANLFISGFNSNFHVNKLISGVK